MGGSRGILSNPMDREEISFGHFRLDLGRRELLRDGKPVRLPSRAHAILCGLASAKGEVVGKDELLAQLWPDRIVEEGNLHVYVSALRKALDEHGAGHSYIVTVPGRGYRLAGFSGAASADPGAAPLPRPLPIPDKPSIAVLPFDNLNGDPEEQYFADGMVEEIITALSRIRWLQVIARNSSFTYKGQPTDMRLIGRELGVRYVLEGSVRKARDRVRISTQLIEAETGAHLWADRFDGSLDEVFDLQDQVAASVAGVIEPTLQAAEIGRSIGRPAVDPTAYDLYLRALALEHSPRDEFARVFDLLRQALERDPQYGSALSLAAFCYYRMDVHRWSQDVHTTRRNGLDSAQRALRLDPENPGVLSRAAFVLGYFGEDIHTAIALIDRCLELNSNHAMGWYRSGILRNWAGQPEAALRHFDKYLELNPRGRFGNYLTAISISLFLCRRFEEAAAKMRECLEHWPDHTVVCRFLAASYAHLGRLAAAREIVQRLGAAVLDDGSRFRSSEHRQLYLSGLRLAVDEHDQWIPQYPFDAMENEKSALG
jgi:adenylate cyclase